MKFFIAFTLLVAAAAAVPVSNGAEKDAVVVRNDLDNIGVGNFAYASETTNGIVQQAKGQLKNVGTENEALEVSGQFSYPGPDGVIYTVNYVANELGFQPSAPHLPVAPTA